MSAAAIGRLTAVATATTPTNGPPLTVSFSGAGSTDPDNDSLTYTWTFGDGATGTGVTVSHTYTATGTYSATLTVNDRPNGTGLSSTSQPILVTVGNRAPTGVITLPATGSTYNPATRFRSRARPPILKTALARLGLQLVDRVSP